MHIKKTQCVLNTKQTPLTQLLKPRTFTTHTQKVQICVTECILTPSLPRCHLKTTNKSEKSETPLHFCLLFHTFYQNA